MKKIITLAFVCTSFLTGAQIPSNVPINGLMGYWPFTGNANDLSGAAHHGTVVGAQLSNDRFNNAVSSYSFNGTSDYISTNYAGILGSGARSVSFWAKTSHSLSSIIAVGWGSNSPANRFNCGFNYNGNGATIGIADGAITYTSPSNISDNQWHHYVFQFSGTTLNQVLIYQDAALLTQTLSALNPASILNTTQGFNVQFGRVDFASSPDFFNGQLDDIGLWNRALTQSEIISLYNGTANATEELNKDGLVFEVFPNPSNDIISIRSNKSVQIDIYNQVGERIIRGNNLKNWSFANLPRGLYFVVATTNNNRRITRDVVIQ